MSGDEGKRKLTYANNCCANWSVDGKRELLEGFFSVVASLGGEGGHAVLTDANQSIPFRHVSIFFFFF